MSENEKSFPWDDLDEDREYNADDFGAYYASLFSPGVLATANFGSALQVTESASLGMRVKYSAGAAFSTFGRGYIHTLDEEVDIPIASTLQDRVDSVVVQFNKSERDAFFVYKQGDISVTRTDTIFEIQMAQITISKNATQITNANIKDMRADKTVCGYATPYGDANVGDITAQFEAWFEAFKGKLGEDPATNLQQQIDTLNDKVVHNTGDESISGNKTFTDTVSVKNLEVTEGANVKSLVASEGISSKIYESKTATASIEFQYFRVGNMVTMTTHTLVGIAQATTYNIPVGFRPYNNGGNPIYEQVFSSGATAILRSSNATWQPRASGGVGTGLWATTTYPTNDDFPTS
ncbi:hypothetical protein [Lactococcus protaetiae]|uniref:Uncharacterized protein n=1 Tax=Lactococcus protaetiae TaxID=2592653 RepID=A0A514Z6Y8_9LACT|nr:hypothetical protein [Lactococcus protaetiae]QDK70354.1 hypothetical protein FLP15_03190 [Lactococcus protaetiae]